MGISNGNPQVGVSKVINEVGSASATYVDVRPASGKKWKIWWLVVSHDDGTARTLSWSHYDGTTEADMPGTAAAKNAGYIHPYGLEWNVDSPMVLPAPPVA